MLITDEFNAAYEYNMTDRESDESIIINKPESAELILTERNPAQKFIYDADYVSHINSVRHPYESGIMARKVTEF